MRSHIDGEGDAGFLHQHANAQSVPVVHSQWKRWKSDIDWEVALCPLYCRAANLPAFNNKHKQSVFLCTHRRSHSSLSLFVLNNKQPRGCFGKTNTLTHSNIQRSISWWVLCHFVFFLAPRFRNTADVGTWDWNRWINAIHTHAHDQTHLNNVTVSNILESRILLWNRFWNNGRLSQNKEKVACNLMAGPWPPLLPFLLQYLSFA